MENLIDDDLKNMLGDRYIPEDTGVSNAEYEQTDTNSNLLNDIKWPIFFLGMGIFIGWSGHMDLMETVLSVPGMCVCAACFGWHVKGMSK